MLACFSGEYGTVFEPRLPRTHPSAPPPAAPATLMSRADGEISPLAWLWNCLHARSGSLRCRAHSERLTVCRALIFRRYPNIVCEFLVRARCRGNVAAERVRQATVGFAIAVVG